MKTNFYILLPIFLLAFFTDVVAQPVSLFEEHHGHINFQWFGQSNNVEDNSNSGFSCSNDNTSSSSTNIDLPVGSTVKKALLYWSGSGSGDFDVTLSGPGFSDLAIKAEREFQETFALKNFFAAAYDITSTVNMAGSGSYTLSNLGASTGFTHCVFNTIYSGWSILIIYESPTLPFSTVRIYDGFEPMQDETQDYLIDDILIESSDETKFGILAWEGDVFFSPEESVRINNTQLSDSENPGNQIFNQTNSSNSGSTSYNMDLDIFDISNQISVGDQQIPIKLTIGGDLIFLNAFAIAYQNKLPNGSVTINSATAPCNQNTASIDFEIFNQDCNDILPQGTDISFYKDDASGQLIASAETLADIAINGSEAQSITFNSPGGQYDIVAIVDPLNTVLEIDESNNADVASLTLQQVQVFASFSDTICYGDSIAWQGMFYDSDILLIDTFLATNGCDSILDYTLTVHPKLESNLDTTLCASNLPFVLPDGMMANNTDIYTSIIASHNGCDSTIYTNLLIEPAEWTETVEICPGDSLLYEGQFYSSDTTLTSIHPSTTGGCDSVITLNIHVKPLLVDTVFATLCEGANYELPNGTTAETPGTYETKTNCNQLTISILSKDTTSNNFGLPDSLQVIFGESLQLVAQPNFDVTDIIWTPNTYLECPTCLTTNSTPNTNITYHLSGANEHGCTVNDQVYINVITPTNDIFIPNAFSPNNDGHNDEFLIYGTNITKILQLEIYDRWGSLMFAQNNLSTTEGWDGRYKGQLLNTGTYLYVAKIQFRNGEIKLFSGDISLWQ